MTSEEHKARRLAKWATRIDIARSAESTVAHLHTGKAAPHFMTDVEHRRRLRQRQHEAVTSTRKSRSVRFADCKMTFSEDGRAIWSQLTPIEYVDIREAWLAGSKIDSIKTAFQMRSAKGGVSQPLATQENIFASDFGLTKHDGIWRTMSGQGEIHGLPASRGRAIATNGVLIAIDVNREAPFIGHVAWWIADDNEDEDVLKDVKPRKTKKQKIMSELIDC